MTVILGIAIDHLGLASQTCAVDPPLGSPHAFEVQRVYSALPASNVAATQPSTVPVDFSHDGRAVGLVEHLTLDPRGNIWAVAWVDDDIDADQLARSSYSVDARLRRPDTQWTINSIALTSTPAMTCLGKLRVVPDASDGVRKLTERQILRVRRTDPFAASVLERAATAARDRRRGQPLVIASTYDPPEHPRTGDAWPRRAWQPRADEHGIWHSAHRGRIISVH